jgi:hypothetical protein
VMIRHQEYDTGVRWMAHTPQPEGMASLCDNRQSLPLPKSFWSVGNLAAFWKSVRKIHEAGTSVTRAKSSALTFACCKTLRTNASGFRGVLPSAKQDGKLRYSPAVQDYILRQSLLVAGNDVEVALEVSALHNLDSLRRHSACQRSIASQVNKITGVDVSEHPAEHDDFASRYVGKHFGILPYRDAAIGYTDYPFNFSLNEQRLRPNNFALDSQAFANCYRACSICKDK